MTMNRFETEGMIAGRFLSESGTEDNIDKTMGQYTVFLVEDNPDDQKQAVQVLRKSPYVYNVHCMKNGEELIGHFSSAGYYAGTLVRHIPVLILLDIHIPGSDGLEILRTLKDHPLTEDIPVIIVTGDTSNEAVMDAYRLKANGFIAKPLSLDHVHEVIYKGRSWPHKA